MTDVPIGLDGWAVRPSQSYAQEKLYFVGRYQDIFATGMKNSWDGRVYFDLLAGPGRCRLIDTGHEFAGSPVLSLEAPFTNRVFVEASPVLAEALRRRVPATCHVLEADCNDPSTIAALRAHCPPKTLGLAFVDNLGLNVPLATLRALTHGKPIDLMIVVQVQDLTRNILDVLDGRDSRERLDDFFGDSGWDPIARAARARGAMPGEIASLLVDFYQQRLKSIGYPHVEERVRPMRNSRNAPQYQLVLAGKHERAIDFFRKIQKIEYDGQRTIEWD